MKKSIFIITGAFLVSVVLCSQQLNAQEKTQQEKEKEAKLQQIIDQQKKAMQEQEMKTQQIEQVLREAERNMSRGNEAIDTYVRSSRGRSSGNYEPFVVTPNMNFQFFGGGEDAERTTWDFTRNVKESTFSKQYSFDVEKSVGNVVMSVTGDCKAGEIRVQIIMPGGKTYSDILIDEFGNLNWRKSFKISDEENTDKTGEWQFKINAKKASGYFRIFLQTF